VVHEAAAKKLVNEMDSAYEQDLDLIKEKKPPVCKLKLLPHIESAVKKTYMQEMLLSQSILLLFSRWLKPMQKGGLPSLEIRSKLLELLVGMNEVKWHNHHDDIRDSNIGRTIKYLFKHPKELVANKQNAKKLIDCWTNSIITAESDSDLNYEKPPPISSTPPQNPSLSKKAKALMILEDKLKTRKASLPPPFAILPKPTVFNIRAPPPPSRVEKKGKSKATKSISVEESGN